MNIIVTGSLGYDTIMNFSGRFADRIMPDKIHQISLSFLVDALSKQFGGTAGNIAYSLKLLGVEPLILSAGGNDFGDYSKHLREKKINTKYIKTLKDVSTGAYHVVTDKEDNQIGSFFMGALKYNVDLSLSNITEPLDFVVIAPNDPAAMNKYVTECKQMNIPYLYDPAFQIDNFSSEDLKKSINSAEILIGNDYEIALIEKKLHLKHEELISKIKVLVTTLGNKGSVIESQNTKLEIEPAKPKNTSDPTGAGDAYRAGFLVGYLRKFDLKTCGQMGAVAAVYTVEKYGTQTHKFTNLEFKKRYEENYSSPLNL